MAIKLLNPNSKASFNQRFREKRFNFFLSQLKKLETQESIEILDIGGTETYWERMNFKANSKIHVTLLNVDQVEVSKKNFISIKGDACDLSMFEDNKFDIIYSNSVIEHLFSFENQRKMANEVMRVGKYYSVQTPNYYFPVEPHWLFPCFQFFPFKFRVFLTQHFNLGHYKKSESKAAAIKRVDEVKLLTEREMKNLFPNGKVYREKFLGLTKSITMYYFP